MGGRLVSGQQFRRYVVLPSDGFRSRVLAQGQLQTNSSLPLSRPGTREQSLIRVLDEISADGPKLVEMPDEHGEIALMREYAGEIRVIPLHMYERPDPVGQFPTRAPVAPEGQTVAHGEPVWRVRIVESNSERPIAGARVAAFTSFRHREGGNGESGSDGIALIPLPPGTRVERLYVYPPAGFWGHYRPGLTTNGIIDIPLRPVRPDLDDLVLARFRGDLPLTAGAGVRIGIIDTGIAKAHPKLHVAGGRNCVFDETAENPAATDDWDDVDHHGSHVAGIVAARPSDDCPVCGVAPQAEIRAYRVFPREGRSASNFDIMKAIHFAIADGCHIINLSFGGNFLDEAVRAALGDARGAGVLAIGAAGNQGRKPVLFPAAYETVMAVSAIGVRGTFPADSLDETVTAPPFSAHDKRTFLASFTNVGPQIKFTAPGVGVVSTVPGGLLPLSGTSMAAPMVAGLAAAILSADPAFIRLPADTRLKELIRDLYDRTMTLGFDRDHEGAGLPLPNGSWRIALAGR